MKVLPADTVWRSDVLRRAGVSSDPISWKSCIVPDRLFQSRRTNAYSSETQAKSSVAAAALGWAIAIMSAVGDLGCCAFLGRRHYLEKNEQCRHCRPCRCGT